MALTRNCGCGQQLRVQEEYIGRKVQCPGCGAPPVVPGPDQDDDRPRREARVPTGTSGKAVAALVFGILSFCLPVLATIPAIGLALLGMGDITRSGGRLGGKGLAVTGVVLSLVGSLFGLLLAGPFILGYGMKGVHRAARIQREEKLQHIAHAMNNYLLTNHTYPPAVVYDWQGKPLYSWRVLLLPFLEEEHLYSQFALDEPWNSPTNLPLLDRMPRVYRPVLGPAGNGTCYKVLVTQGQPRLQAMFSDGPGTRVGEVTDGLSNTIMVVEFGKPVPWTKPDDISFHGNGQCPVCPAALPSGSMPVIMANGNVLEIPSTVPPDVIYAMITRNGGEPIDWDELLTHLSSSAVPLLP